MIQVELIGCTSAGKSTFAKAMLELATEANIDLVTGDTVALSRVFLPCPRSKGPRAILLHLAATFGCLVGIWQHRPWLSLARQILRRSGISWFMQMQQLRLLLKQFGRFELIRRSKQIDSIVLVDEGTVHTAHNLLVHVNREPCVNDIQEFSRLAPLPDVVIYIRLPKNVIVNRVLKRGHRRVANPSRQSAALFVDHAVTTFEGLTKCDRIASRLLIVENGKVIDMIRGAQQDPRLLQLKRLAEDAAELCRAGNETNSKQTALAPT